MASVQRELLEILVTERTDRYVWHRYDDLAERFEGRALAAAYSAFDRRGMVEGQYDPPGDYWIRATDAALRTWELASGGEDG